MPEELPAIPEQQVYGLATPEDFTLPPHHPLWTEEVYKAFDVADSTQDYDTKVSITKAERWDLSQH